MPVVTLTVPQTHETVTRSVVRGVTADLIRQIGLPDDTDVIFREEVGSTPTPGATIDERPDVVLSHDNHVYVNYNVKFTEDGILFSNAPRDQYPYLFWDKPVGIDIKPEYGRCKASLSFKVTFRGRSQLERFKRVLRMRGGIRTLTNKHEIRYEYSLPDEILGFLFDAHSMMLPDETTGEKENLKTYLHRCFLGGLGRRVTRDGKKSRLLLDEIQGNIIGLFSEEVFYDEVSTDGALFSAEFTYSFEFDMITAVMMRYPNIIHNQRIPRMYRQAWIAPERYDLQEDPRTHKSLAYLPPIWKAKVGRFYRGDGGHRIDPTDEYEPPAWPINTRSLVWAPIVVDSADPHLLLNLNDFTEEQLPLDVRDYILAYPEESLRLHGTPYYVNAYQVGEKAIQTVVTIQPNGDIRSVNALPVRKRHYLRIAMMYDLAMLNYSHVSDMLVNPYRTLQVFQHLHPDVDFESGKWLKLIGNKKIHAESWRQSVKKLPTTNRPYAKLVETSPKFSSYNIIHTRKGRNDGSRK